jgi:hypothetical protein
VRRISFAIGLLSVFAASGVAAGQTSTATDSGAKVFHYRVEQDKSPQYPPRSIKIHTDFSLFKQQQWMPCFNAFRDAKDRVPLEPVAQRLCQTRGVTEGNLTRYFVTVEYGELFTREEVLREMLTSLKREIELRHPRQRVEFLEKAETPPAKPAEASK